MLTAIALVLAVVGGALAGGWAASASIEADRRARDHPRGSLDCMIADIQADAQGMPRIVCPFP